jgi:hypothetical protein
VTASDANYCHRGVIPPFGGWCNRKHGGFWSRKSGFESCPPSSFGSRSQEAFKRLGPKFWTVPRWGRSFGPSRPARPNSEIFPPGKSGRSSFQVSAECLLLHNWSMKPLLVSPTKQLHGNDSLNHPERTIGASSLKGLTSSLHQAIHDFHPRAVLRSRWAIPSRSALPRGIGLLT